MGMGTIIIARRAFSSMVLCRVRSEDPWARIGFPDRFEAERDQVLLGSRTLRYARRSRLCRSSLGSPPTRARLIRGHRKAALVSRKLQVAESHAWERAQDHCARCTIHVVAVLPAFRPEIKTVLFQRLLCFRRPRKILKRRMMVAPETTRKRPPDPPVAT